MNFNKKWLLGSVLRCEAYTFSLKKNRLLGWYWDNENISGVDSVWMQDSALVWSKVSSIARRGNYHWLNTLLHVSFSISGYFFSTDTIQHLCHIENIFHHTFVVYHIRVLFRCTCHLPIGKRDFKPWPSTGEVYLLALCMCIPSQVIANIYFCKNESTHQVPNAKLSQSCY
jgi:hypothetical protein